MNHSFPRPRSLESARPLPFTRSANAPLPLRASDADRCASSLERDSARRDDPECEPPSIAFSRTGERLRSRSPFAALAVAALVGVLGYRAFGAASSERIVAPPRATAPAEACEVTSDVESLESACGFGDAIACNDLGVHYERGLSAADSARTAFRHFDRACAGGSADGCGNLGALYERGDGVSVDLARAVELYTRACSAGAPLACSNLGALYARGKGVPKDPGEAQRLFTWACQAGSSTGCQNLTEMGPAPARAAAP